MPTEVIMPKVDMDMSSGKIMTWHVAEGSAVAQGDPLFDIETDKAAMEVEAPTAGILHHRVAEGTDVPIGKPVAWLYAEGEEVGEAPAGAPASAPEPAPSEPDPVPEPEQSAAAAPAPQGSEAPAGDTGIRATPKARALARQAGIDLSALTGTGPRGRIQAEDVPRPAAPHSAVPASFTPETGPLAINRSKSGSGTPVVLIHGFSSDATSWAPLEPHLRHRPVIRIDLPCHGKSPKLSISDFPALVATLRQALDSLGEDSLHLVGHSLGGALALALADTRPRSVASLSLIAPAGLGPEINGDVLSGICRATQAGSLKPWLKTLVADETLITDAYARTVMATRSAPDFRAAQARMAETLFADATQSFDLNAALHRIEMPARILWGKSDAIIPWRHALRAPGQVALHLLDGIGHLPQIEAPEVVGKILGPHL